MPEIGKNLISVGTLEEKGCDFKGSKGVLKVTKGCSVIMKTVRKGTDTLYFLQGSARTTDFESNIVKKDADSESYTRLWHSRLGHVGQKSMDVLGKKGCFDSNKVTEVSFCEDCVLGKTHRVSFGPAKHVTKAKLDYIHSDLWESPNVPMSLGRCQYFVSFTDDWSRKVWIYFLKTKDEAFEKFVEWKKTVEVQSERKVKRLRTDNGLEFCNQRKIGVAERLNRTIMNKVRSMLSESGLELRFWAEAASTSVYLINRTPSSAIEFDIPEERWSSAVPHLSGLRKFGCVAHTHSDDGKLIPRAKKGIFTSYPSGVKGFRIWLLEEEKCLISRNIVFKEVLMYKHVKSEVQSPNSSDIPVITDVFVSDDLAGKNTGSEAQHQGGATETEILHSPEPENQNEDQDQTGQDLEGYQLARDRLRRQTKKPSRLDDFLTEEEDEEDIAGYAYLIIEDGGRPAPGNYQEALDDPDSEKWLVALDDEMESLMKNKT
ncbi:unnamed protein product [Microthlaspi erraticum]|uniref:Uncharacterized protein n=1 Tax=Microthlaspi erraticum TaxID=1685480 RepID=A0A6D2IJ58_9BRAS|nr:unnamed protein product [Microthlaspi erraticum]